MRKFALVLLLLFNPAALRAQIPGTNGWSDISNTQIDPGHNGGLVCNPPNPNSQCHNVIDAWNSGVMDTLRNRMIIWGGGHGDYAGNEVYAINLNPASAQRITDNTNPSGCSQSTCGGTQSDGGPTPNSRHTYDGIEYMPNIDRMFVFGGAPAGAGFPFLQDTWTFDFATKLWHLMSPTGTIPNGQPGTSTAYDPNTGYVFIDDLSHAIAYNYSANTMILYGNNGTLNNYASVGVVDPVRKYFMVLGGGDFRVYDISSTGHNSANWRGTTSGNTACETTSYPGVVYDPGTDRVVCWLGGDTVYSLNTVTKAWTTITMYTGGPALGFQGTFGRWNYSTTDGVFALVTSTTVDLHTLRLGPPPAPDVTAPSTPSNLTASAVSASQINLAWTGSTDNVAVSGYKVERCSGGGCSNFAQIGTSSGTTYQDTGLTASTLYQYRVRAFDAATNNSAYSNTAFTTTLDVDATPPSAPSGLMATVVSYQRVDLVWTASTDNVGVTGYQVEKCAGSGCSSFTLASSPTGTSVSITGLAGGTLYRFRVRATDAAANVSSYSSTVDATTSSAPVLQVGTGKAYATVSDAYADSVDGSVIECDAGIYANESITILHSLTIRGVGGRCHFKWGTGDWTTNAGNLIPNGQAIIRAIPGASGSVTLENLEFSGARVTDQNGAGLRWTNGDITVRGSYFHNNEEGILGGPNGTNTALIENNFLDQNGYCDTFCNHNIYISNPAGRLIFRFNKSTNVTDGHALKSRALINEVYSNFFSTRTGNGSLESEFPNGGTVYYIGNVIEQGASSSNSTMLSFGAEGQTNPTQELYVVNNTFFSYRDPQGVFVQVLNGTPTAIIVKNNLFGGDGAAGTQLSGASADLTSNLAVTSASFVDPTQIDYRFLVLPNEAIVDAGVDPGFAGSYSLTPTTAYLDPYSSVARTIVGSAIDRGAYELGTPVIITTNRPSMRFSTLRLRRFR